MGICHCAEPTISFACGRMDREARDGPFRFFAAVDGIIEVGKLIVAD